MTTGQPIRYPSDRNKYNNEYMESLQLQINLNQQNLNVNRLYKETGQLPASVQMMDNRSNEEKIMDVHNLKQSIISDLRPIAEPMFASSVIQGVIDSPLNVDNSLFRYLAQNASTFAQTLSKKYKFGIAGDANDVAIMVQFLEDAYNKTKNTFQSIKGYINSNTNEGNKTRSNTLSANDTDNLIIELKDILKRLEGMQLTTGNYSINTVNNIQIISDLIIDILQFLPSSDQMKEIIDLITAQQEETSNPRIGNPYDPRFLAFGQLTAGGIATAVLKILSSSLPKLSSVQTIIDRLFRAVGQRDQRNIEQSTSALVNLFANFNTPENRAIMEQFRDEYMNRANTIIQRQTRQNEINYADQMRINNAAEAADKKAQRVYIVNPANDAVHVIGNMGLGNPGASIDFEGEGSDISDLTGLSGLQSVSSNGSQQSGLSGLQSVSSAGSQRSGDSIPSLQSSQSSNGSQQSSQSSNGSQQSSLSGIQSIASQQNARDVYITNSVNMLTADGVRELANKMERSRLIDQNDKNGLIDMLRNLRAVPLNDQKDYIISILIKMPDIAYDPSTPMPVNFFNVGGPPGVSGLGLKSNPVKKGRGLYSPFGDSEINHKNLENNILTLRRKSKTNYMDLPSKHISKHMKNILHNIVGGKIANYEDLHNLNDEERNYLNKVINKSNLHDRLSIPAPSKDQVDKDNHQWEVMRGEIMAGNDSHELVKKFKILTMKLTRQGLLPKNEVMDLFEDLVNLGY